MDLGPASALATAVEESAARAEPRPEMSFRAFVERSPDGVALHRDDKLVYANRALRYMLGYETLEEILGHSIIDFVYPEDRGRVAERLRVLREEDREVPVLAERLLHRDGHAVEVEVSSRPIAYEGESTILALVVDVSERKRMVRELDQTVSMLRATLESTADGILVVDCDGSITTYNERFVEMWRIPPFILRARHDESAIAFVIDQLVEPTGFLARMRELYADPNAESFDRIQLTDGRCYERHSLPQRIDGQTVGRVWSFRDVTARKNAEDESAEARCRIEELATVAQRQAAELESVHSSMLDGVVVCDARGIITHVNDASGELTGLAKGAIIGRSLDEYAALVERCSPDGEPIRASVLPIGRALAGEKVVNSTSWSARTGRKIWIRCNAAPIPDAAGRIAGAVAVERDVSDFVELDAMRDQFIRVAAHELKTPVAIMKGHADMLLRSADHLPPSLRGAPVAIERGAKRIDRLVNDLLGVSQLLMGRLELRRERLDVAELVRITARQIAKTTGNHELRIHAEAAEVFGDRVRLTQVIDTLLDNAVRYSPDGGPIEVSVTTRGAEARFSVRDVGVGIPRKKQERIFERFYRAHTDTPHDYGGMGVGLYIAREVIAQHGGRMWFKSEEGHGSEFCFALPLQSSGGKP
jgi:PAS domain S-box-containing protein